MSNCSLDDDALVKISHVVMESTMKSLDLSGNPFGETISAVEEFKRALIDNGSLTELNISFSNFNTFTVIVLLEGLTQNTFLVKVDLSWNALGNNAKVSKALEGLLSQNEIIEELNLGYNNILDVGESNGVDAIAKGLKSNKILKILDLSGNSIHSIDQPKGLTNPERNTSKKGCLKILEALNESDDTVLEQLIMDKVFVGQEFQEFKKESVKLSQMKIITGEVAALPKKKAPPKVNPMVKLKDWLGKNGMTLNSFFVKLDDDDSMSLDYDEFKAGIREYGIPLTDDEITELIGMLDLDGDGDINYA